MNDTRKILFRLQGRVSGQEITPQTIGLSQFNRFNREVEEFLVGSGAKMPLDDVHVSVESGSYGLAVFLSALVAATVEADVHRLAQQDTLRDIDSKRARVVRRWQERARSQEGFAVSIETTDGASRAVSISRETDYHLPDQDEWVATEKYVVGRLLEVGGSTRINVHVAIDNNKNVLIAESTEDYLRNLDRNYLYHRVQVHVAAQENIQTGELRDVRLLAFIGEGPSYDEQELETAIAKGTRAWADVPNSVAWVREQRGGYNE